MFFASEQPRMRSRPARDRARGGPRAGQAPRPSERPRELARSFAGVQDDGQLCKVICAKG